MRAARRRFPLDALAYLASEFRHAFIHEWAVLPAAQVRGAAWKIEAAGHGFRDEWIIALAAAGELTLEESRAFMGLLEQQRKAIEAADLSVRVEALEAELERERGRDRDR
jgi:hypothetical protein